MMNLRRYTASNNLQKVMNLPQIYNKYQSIEGDESPADIQQISVHRR